MAASHTGVIHTGSSMAASHTAGVIQEMPPPLPPFFLCPITYGVMSDPVMAADGTTFDKFAIEAWFAKGKNTNPLTGEKLANTTLIPNRILKSQIEWHAAQTAAAAEATAQAAAKAAQEAAEAEAAAQAAAEAFAAAEAVRLVEECKAAEQAAAEKAAAAAARAAAAQAAKASKAQSQPLTGIASLQFIPPVVTPVVEEWSEVKKSKVKSPPLAPPPLAAIPSSATSSPQSQTQSQTLPLSAGIKKAGKQQPGKPSGDATAPTPPRSASPSLDDCPPLLPALVSPVLVAAAEALEDLPPLLPVAAKSDPAAAAAAVSAAMAAVSAAAAAAADVPLRQRICDAAASPKAENVAALVAEADGDVAIVNWANPGSGKDTALHIAARGPNKVEAVKALIAPLGPEGSYIDVNKVNKAGNTALMEAALHRSLDSVKELLLITTDLSRANKDGETFERMLKKAGVKTEVWKLFLQSQTWPSPLHYACQVAENEAALPIVRRLLATPGVNVNHCNDGGMTPIAVAITNCNTACLALLVACPQVDINCLVRDTPPLDYPPLFFACAGNYIESVRVLLSASGIQVNRGIKGGIVPLVVAIQKGHTEVMQALLGHPQVDVNIEDDDGCLPLFYACQRPECMELLLAHPNVLVNKTSGPRPPAPPGSSDKERQTLHGMSALLVASKGGHAEALRRLLKHPDILVDIRDQDKSETTPLEWSAMGGHVECVKLLLAHPGVDANTAGKHGNNALILCSQSGRAECVRVLLAHPGIDASHANGFGVTALILSSGNGHASCVKLLLRHPGVFANHAASNGETALMGAAYSGHTECLRLLLAVPGIDLSHADEKGNTALTLAKTEEVRALLRDHMDGVRHPVAPAHGKSSGTALATMGAAGGGGGGGSSAGGGAGGSGYLKAIAGAADRACKSIWDAAMEGNAPTLAALLEENAGNSSVLNWCHAEKADATALIAGSAAGHAPCLKLLLSQPAVDVNRFTTNGDTALILSSIQGHADCVTLLLSAPSINVNIQNKFGNTALITTAAQGHVDCTKLLLKIPGIDLTLRTKKGQDAMGLAKNEEMRQLLTAHMRSVAAAKSAISIGKRVWAAAKKGDAAMLKILIGENRGSEAVLCWADPDKNGYTPLVAACYKGNTECARLLLTQSVVKVNQVDKSGQTALILASFCGHAGTTRLLLGAKGVDVNHSSDLGMTALMGAAQRGHAECVALLLGVRGIDVRRATLNGKTALDLAANDECRALLQAHLDDEVTGHND